MLISIVLCHHKGTLVDQAVSTLLNSKGISFEILIMTSDQECRKRYLNFDPRVKPHFMEGGPAIKRNTSLKFSNGEILAFFDDDVTVKEDTVLEMYKAISEPNVGMVFGKCLNMEFHEKVDEAGSFLTPYGFLWARGDHQLDNGQFDESIPILAGKSAACMIKRKVFVECGKFDESYEILAEESDLAWRVWLLGHKVMFVPKSVTFHAFNTKFKPLDFYVPKRVYYNGCRNYLSMLYTNLGRKNWIFPVLFQLFAWTCCGLGMLFTGKRESGYWIFRGIGYFLRNIRNIWKKRYNVQRTLRKISDKTLFPIVMRTPPISYFIQRFFRYVKEGKHG